MKSIRIHERLQEDRGRSEDETGNVISNILKKHVRRKKLAGLSAGTSTEILPTPNINPKKSVGDVDTQVNRIVDKTADRKVAQQGTQIDAKRVGNDPTRKGQFHQASVGRIHRAMSHPLAR